MFRIIAVFILLSMTTVIGANVATMQCLLKCVSNEELYYVHHDTLFVQMITEKTKHYHIAKVFTPSEMNEMCKSQLLLNCRHKCDPNPAMGQIVSILDGFCSTNKNNSEAAALCVDKNKFKLDHCNRPSGQHMDRLSDFCNKTEQEFKCANSTLVTNECGAAGVEFIHNSVKLLLHMADYAGQVELGLTGKPLPKDCDWISEKTEKKSVFMIVWLVLLGVVSVVLVIGVVLWSKQKLPFCQI